MDIDARLGLRVVKSNRLQDEFQKVLLNFSAGCSIVIWRRIKVETCLSWPADTSLADL